MNTAPFGSLEDSFVLAVISAGPPGKMPVVLNAVVVAGMLLLASYWCYRAGRVIGPMIHNVIARNRRTIQCAAMEPSFVDREFARLRASFDEPLARGLADELEDYERNVRQLLDRRPAEDNGMEFT